MENKSKKILAVIPNVAKKIGEKSVSACCTWWFNQPKVPDSMKQIK